MAPSSEQGTPAWEHARQDLGLAGEGADSNAYNSGKAMIGTGPFKFVS